MKLLKIVATVFLVSTVLGCTPPINSTPDKNDTKSGDTAKFYEAVKNVAPAFSGASAKTSRALTTWTSGDPIFELYDMLVDGQPQGYFNLYSLMKSADTAYRNLLANSTAIVKQAIDSPVDLGFNSEDSLSTYDSFYEYSPAAGSTDKNHTKTFSRKDGSVIYLLVLMHNLNSGETKSAVQGVYDETTGDVKIACFSSNLVNGSWETVKARVDGNTLTHKFSLKIIRNAQYKHNVVGYGVSKGTGNSFLMKMANQTMDAASGTFYEFAADVTADTLKTKDAAGSATTTLTEYQSSLPVAYTEADITSIDSAALKILDVTLKS